MPVHAKKKSIIETAVKLFAKKGVDATTIQEIADISGISKGSFYLHFRSKEELVLSIFKHYTERLEQHMFSVQDEGVGPRETFIRQLQKQFEEIMRQKNVVIIQLREQYLYMNDDIEHFFKQKRLEREQWLHSSFLAMYGDPVSPYLADVSNLFQGIHKSYMKLMIVNGIDLHAGKLSRFIVKRLDDIVHGMIKDNETPLLTKSMFNPVLQDNRRIIQLLRTMQKEVNKLNLDADTREELLATLNFLLKEVRSDRTERYIFKGMLANFDGIEPLQPYRKEIADILDL